MIKPTGIVDAIKGTEYLVKCKIDACFEPIIIKRKLPNNEFEYWTLNKFTY